MVANSIPVMLNLDEKPCVIVGSGPVGRRKARQFLAAGALVTIISRSIHEQIDGANQVEALYEQGMLTAYKPFLVVAATNVRAVNQQISVDARAIGALTMVVDAPREADVRGIMQRERDGINFTVTTGSPLLSRLMLDRAEALITPAIATYGAWLYAMRGTAKGLITEQEDRATLWRKVMGSEVLPLLEEGREDAARSLLVEIVGSELAAYLPEA